MLRPNYWGAVVLSSRLQHCPCHAVHHEAEPCKTDLHRVTVQEEIKSHYPITHHWRGRAGRELMCPGSKHRRGISWDGTSRVAAP